MEEQRRGGSTDREERAPVIGPTLPPALVLASPDSHKLQRSDEGTGSSSMAANQTTKPRRMMGPTLPPPSETRQDGEGSTASSAVQAFLDREQRIRNAAEVRMMAASIR